VSRRRFNPQRPERRLLDASAGSRERARGGARSESRSGLSGWPPVRVPDSALSWLLLLRALRRRGRDPSCRLSARCGAWTRPGRGEERASARGNGQKLHGLAEDVVRSFATPEPIVRVLGLHPELFQVTSREERILETEEFYRGVNQVIARTTPHNSPSFLCECANPFCNVSFETSAEDLLTPHSTPGHYAIPPRPRDPRPRRGRPAPQRLRDRAQTGHQAKLRSPTLPGGRPTNPDLAAGLPSNNQKPAAAAHAATTRKQPMTTIGRDPKLRKAPGSPLRHGDPVPLPARAAVLRGSRCSLTRFGSHSAGFRDGCSSAVTSSIRRVNGRQSSNSQVVPPHIGRRSGAARQLAPYAHAEQRKR